MTRIAPAALLCACFGGPVTSIPTTQHVVGVDCDGTMERIDSRSDVLPPQTFRLVTELGEVLPIVGTPDRSTVWFRFEPESPEVCDLDRLEVWAPATVEVTGADGTEMLEGRAVVQVEALPGPWTWWSFSSRDGRLWFSLGPAGGGEYVWHRDGATELGSVER